MEAKSNSRIGELVRETTKLSELKTISDFSYSTSLFIAVINSHFSLLRVSDLFIVLFVGFHSFLPSYRFISVA